MGINSKIDDTLRGDNKIFNNLLLSAFYIYPKKIFLFLIQIFSPKKFKEIYLFPFYFLLNNLLASLCFGCHNRNLSFVDTLISPYVLIDTDANPTHLNIGIFFFISFLCAYSLHLKGMILLSEKNPYGIAYQFHFIFVYIYYLIFLYIIIILIRMYLFYF
jgi:hypothetical protein